MVAETIRIFGAPVTVIGASTRGFSATRGGAIETSALIRYAPGCASRRQLETVQPRLQHDRLAADRIVVAVELEIGGDRRLRFTFDIDSKCEALIGAH